MLNVIDDVTEECLAEVADTSLSSKRVVRERDALITRRCKPTRNPFAESFHGRLRDELLL